MTLTVVAKVDAGMVLAGDSSVSKCVPTAAGGYDVEHVFTGGEKVLQLVDGLPIGLLHAGVYSLGGKLTSEWAREFGEQLGRELDPGAYELRLIADKALTFFGELYDAEAVIHPDLPRYLQIHLAGYAPGAPSDGGEVYAVRFGPEAPGVHLRIAADKPGLDHAGKGQEMLERIHTGCSPRILQAIVEHLKLTLTPDDAKALKRAIRARIGIGSPPASASLPEVLAYLDVLFTAEYIHAWWGDGPRAIVCGPTDLAVITREAGFRWVRRNRAHDLAGAGAAAAVEGQA